MQKTKIDWPWKPLWTFNPVVGCKRICSINGKPYCYARRIHERFHKTPFTDVVFHPERLKKKPCAPHVFVGSMSDIEYWKPEWVRAMIDYCAKWPGHNFYFLSKNPLSYVGYNWPDNCFAGLTMTLQEDFAGQYEKINKFGFDKRRFLSLEPLLGTLKLDRTFFTDYHAIIVGAMTGPGAVKPKPEWIDSIKRLNLKNVYWKNNIGGNGRGERA